MKEYCKRNNVLREIIVKVKVKGKGHFYLNVGSSFSPNETAINGSRRKVGNEIILRNEIGR